MKRKTDERKEPGQARRGIAAGLAIAGVTATVIGGCAAISGDGLLGAGGARQPIVQALPLATYGNQTAQGYYALGKYYFFQGSLDRAEQAYQRAVELDPNDPEPHNGLGVLYDRLGRFDQARVAYAAALEMAPGAPHILANLGYSLLLQGRPAEAIAPLRQALALDPDNALTLAHLAQAEAGSTVAATSTSEAATPDGKRQAQVAPPAPAAAGLAETSIVPRHLADAAVPYTNLERQPRQAVHGIIRNVIAANDGAETAAPTTDTMVVSVLGAEHHAAVLLATVFNGLRIEISNGNGVTGMARALRSKLRQQGLNVSRVTNARPYVQRETVVLCAAAMREAAAQLGATLPVTPMYVTRSTANRNVDLRVILGADSVAAGGRPKEPQRLSRADK